MSEKKPRSKTAMMDFIKRHSPTREELMNSRFLRPFAHRIAHSHLWRFTRTSVPRGTALGLFVGIFFLLPGAQILGVALLALPFRANIPIGAAMTFLSNPFTTPLIIAASVWLGDRMFGLKANVSTFSAMVEHGASAAQWTRWLLSDAAPALLTGLFVISTVAAVLGYFLAMLFWDSRIRMRWRAKLRREADQRLAASTSDTPEH